MTGIEEDRAGTRQPSEIDRAASPEAVAVSEIRVALNNGVLVGAPIVNGSTQLRAHAPYANLRYGVRNNVDVFAPRRHDCRSAATPGRGCGVRLGSGCCRHGIPYAEARLGSARVIQPWTVQRAQPSLGLDQGRRDTSPVSPGSGRSDISGSRGPCRLRRHLLPPAMGRLRVDLDPVGSGGRRFLWGLRRSRLVCKEGRPLECGVPACGSDIRRDHGPALDLRLRPELADPFALYPGPTGS